MSNSAKPLRWAVLALVAAVIVALRALRGELLQGKNPLLLVVLLLALGLAYREFRRK